MTRNMVLGANGQDGSYLCEILTARGEKVWGVGRQSGPAHRPAAPGFTYVQADLRDHAGLTRLLDDLMPDRVFHVAAVHGAAGFAYEQVWDAALDVNVKSMHAVLEHLRRRGGGRAVYASSAKVFGTPLSGRLSLASPQRADCLYATTKIAAGNLIAHYRRAHGVHCGIAYLFNHESVRRPAGYFIPQLLGIVRQALRTPRHRGQVGTLDFYCDWGCAREYMELMTRFASAERPLDAILASGRTWHARDMAGELFARHNLDIRDHVEERLPPQTPSYYAVELGDTQRDLGAVPQRSILDVCEDFLRS